MKSRSSSADYRAAGAIRDASDPRRSAQQTRRKPGARSADTLAPAADSSTQQRVSAANALLEQALLSPPDGSETRTGRRRDRSAGQRSSRRRLGDRGTWLGIRGDHRSSRLRRLLLATDTAAIALAFALVASFAANVRGEGTWLANLPVLVIGLPAWIMLTHAHGLYHVHSHSADYGAADEVGPIIQMSVLWGWALALTITATGLGDLTIGKLAVFWLLGVLLMMSFRGAVRVWARRRAWFPENAIVIGAGRDVAAVVSKVLRHPEWGLNLVACVDYSDDEESVRCIDKITVMRGDIDLIDVIDKLQVQRVMAAWSTGFAHTTEERFELVRELADRDVHVNLIPSWIEVIGARLELRELEGVPLLDVPPMRLSHSSLFLKRGLDITLSVLALVVLAPLMLLCAIAIKLDSPGPVFFRQRRIGREGKPFELLKLRSMVVDADGRKDEFAGLTIHGGDDYGMFKIRADPRVTRIGSFLRRTSIDEVPTLYNVLMGDMSLVGPRPLIENEDRQVSGRFRRRLSLTPGVTGLWQVSGRSEIPFEQMVNLDYLYVTSWSLWGDVKILIKTIPAVAKGRGAY